MKMISAVAALALCAGVVLADVDETQTTQKTFTMGGGSRKLIVDNVNGSIEVTGYSGSGVQVTVREHWRADSPEKMLEAKRDVRLDMSQSGNDVKLYVDGPFRCGHNCTGDHGRTGYNVAFDFEVKVPMDAALDLKTVNGGKLRVNGSQGDFNIHSVNGAIELKDMAGAGSVNTVNGGISVGFREIPRAQCSFKTVNGSVDVTFPAHLSADLSMKTFNGSVYTDFDVTALPGAPVNAERVGSMNRYRSDRFTNVRVGAGGLTHTFDTLNGTIRIKKS
jgi:DUF4097 and DUF4098 domain-containing protein YvlB